MKQYFAPQTPLEYMALILIVLATGLSLFPPPGAYMVWWESHAFELMLALLFSGLFFFFINRTRLMFIAFAGCAIMCYFLNVRTVTKLKPAEQSETAFSLRIGAFRVSPTKLFARNALPAIIDSDLDIIALQEVPPSIFPRIHDTLLFYGYNYYQFEPDSERNQETAVYSRYPIEFLRSIRQHNVPCISGRLILPLEDSLRELRFLYTSMPTGSPMTDKASAQLYMLGRQLGQTRSPVLALGNFNLLPWSYHLQVFKKRSALQDSRQGIRPASRQGFLTIFERPTDHIFYSHHFKCVSFNSISDRNGANIGITGTYQLEIKGLINHVQQTSRKL